MKVNKEVFYHAYSGEKVNVGDVLVFNFDFELFDEDMKEIYNINGNRRYENW